MSLDAYIGELPQPQHPTIGAIIADALPTLRPPRRMDPPTWAEAERMLRTPTYSGRWRNDFAPYMVEPSRMTNSRRYSSVVFSGPARTVKTDALVLNTFGHRVACMPRDVLIVAPTKDAAREFSITKLDTFIRANPAVERRQQAGRGTDNIFDKRFLGNMRVRIGWPVIGQLSMVDIPDVLLTDYDRMPDDVDGEGAAFDLALKRTQTFGSLGMCVVESSPGRPVLDEEWSASTPHEAPPATGILGLYNAGTRGRWYWECPQCNEAFQPLFERLSWEVRDTPAESAKTVTVGCPHCGFPIPPAMKPELNRTGFWLHETADGQVVDISDHRVRETDSVTYLMEGPAAAMQSLQQLVLRHIDAEEEFKRTGDEARLKTTVNVDQGRPYTPRVRLVGEALQEDVLRASAENFKMGEAPAATRFITVQVDVQASRFVVSVEAWGEGLEHWLIDRYDLTRPPNQNGEGRAIDPARFAEDWSALDPLLARSWAVVGSDHELMARALIVDSGGAPGVTGNAYKWWRAKRKAGLAHRAFLGKGVGGLDRDRAAYVVPEKVEGTRQKRRSDLRIVRIGTDPLKDEIAAAITRREPGLNAYHLPIGLDASVFAEFCAEARADKGWEKKKHGIRNEALDLAVMAKALVVVLKAEKIDWAVPPDWAKAPHENAFRVSKAPLNRAESQGVPETEKQPAPKARRKRGKGFVARGFDG